MITSGNEYHIGSAEQGAVMLALSVISTAVDDVRLYLAPPETTRADQRINSTDRRALIEKGCQERRRAIHARSAAAFLQNDAQVWVRALEACGVQVPMKKLFLQLKSLKKQEVPAHG